jgi:hypothetical protein
LYVVTQNLFDIVKYINYTVDTQTFTIPTELDTLDVTVPVVELFTVEL